MTTGNALEGKVALVTGASGGIGSAIATELAAEAATLALAYGSDAASAEALAAEITSTGPADLLSARALPSLAAMPAHGIRLRARTGLAEPLIADLAVDELDLVLATRHVRAKGIRHETLFTERLILVAGVAWARRLQRIDPETLKAAPLVAFDDDLPLIRRYWRAVFGARPDPVAGICLPDLRGICHTVAAGAGIAVVPQYVAAPLITTGDLVELTVPAEPPTNRLTLAYRPAALDRPGVAEVRNALLRAAPGWQT
jgi:DNA-binding transcriptional LysR family regulator